MVATRERLQREDRRSAVALAVLGSRLTKAALAVLGVIVVLQQIGFNATGILAGLGVGGVAVALAAQKTIANLFGGFSLATDQPVRIGDFCRFGDKSGWVEDVGMRSTRIRTLDRSVITVPNSEFAEVQLENMSVRDRMRLWPSSACATRRPRISCAPCWRTAPAAGRGSARHPAIRCASASSASGPTRWTSR